MVSQHTQEFVFSYHVIELNPIIEKPVVFCWATQGVVLMKSPRHRFVVVVNEANA